MPMGICKLGTEHSTCHFIRQKEGGKIKVYIQVKVKTYVTKFSFQDAYWTEKIAT